MSLTIKELCVDLQKTRILKNINLEIRTGEFVSLLGASGCGKTTLLKSIAGLLETQEGDIRIDDTSITNLAPEKRGTVIVFQDLRLFPHMTVEQNISFSMDLKKIPKKDKQAQVGELLKAVQLEGFEKRKIREMSGGQRRGSRWQERLRQIRKFFFLMNHFQAWMRICGARWQIW